MSYAVKELFYTLQGEGGNAGRAAVFCRFAGCNLWSGRPEDRARASCQFCDTDFVGTDGTGGGRFATAAGLFFAGTLVNFFGGDYSRVGAVMALIYALGMIVIWFAPDTTNKSLEE